MFDVEVLDTTNPSDELVARVNAFDNEMWAESDPEEPLYPRGITRMKLTETWRSFDHRRWAATTADGTIAGMARLDVHTADPDDPTASLTLQVAPRFRNEGVGRALLAEAVADVRRRGRSVLGGATTDRVPAGARFAERLGAEPKLVQRESECLLADVDRDMVERWITIPADVEAEYELWRSTEAYPPESYAAIAELQNVMNTQPFDDLERRDVQFTPEHVAHNEAQRDWSLGDRWTHFVRHRSSGKLAGYTRVYLWHTWTGMAEQGDTGVDPAHRGRGLGKWLKGSMVHHLLTERPAVERIRTTNAFTNGPMLAINEALGFKVTRTITDWQVPVAAIDLGDS